jgi:hypothetical protein
MVLIVLDFANPLKVIRADGITRKICKWLMQIGKSSKIYLIGMGLALFLISGCAGKTIRLAPDNYQPAFSTADFGSYKGKQLYLYSIANHDRNAGAFFYRSGNGRDAYDPAPATLEAYLWFCFKKAFERAGITVWEKGASARIPIIQVRFDAISDQRFHFEVVLRRDDVRLFQKVMLVRVKPVASRDPAKLEQGAYRMVDESVTALLKDADFHKAFLSAI